MNSSDFDAAFASIIDDSLPSTSDDDLLVARDRIREILEYNVPHGKRNRGLSVLTSYRHLKSDHSPNARETRQIHVLGWCVEILQAWLLIADDIMDSSVTRRGRDCWYRREGVGLVAINDAFITESIVYKLLKKHFRGETYYIDLVELFVEITHDTEIGQMLDLATAPEGKPNFDYFTLQRYKAIVKYKTAFYSFYLPVALAMRMAGLTDEKDFERAKKILLMMGEYFQIQDDYLDCYGDPKVTGKIGTDIEDNKCSWLIVQALAKVTAEQRKILEENYALKDSACVERVKKVYADLDLEGAYRTYEDLSYKQLMELIEKECGSLPKAMFIDFASRIYKRNK